MHKHKNMMNLNKKIQLRYDTPKAWANKVLTNFDAFLNDHAAAEKKASGMAMSMALHYRHKTRLVTEMIDLSIEELQHFRACVALLHKKDLTLLPDEKVAEALPEGDMKNFYNAITASEDKHQTLFVDLAKEYFDEETIRVRLNELLDLEAELVKQLPIRAALH